MPTDRTTLPGWLGQKYSTSRYQREFNSGDDWQTVAVPASQNPANIAYEPASGGVSAGASGTSTPVTVGGNDRGNVDLQGGVKDWTSWVERVQNYSPWNDVFSVTEQESSLVVDVPFENRYMFLPHVLGAAWVDPNDPYQIRRINPIQHPYWPWMRVSRVANVGVKYVGGRTYMPGHTSRGIAKYKLARYTLGFSNYPWTFLSDDELATAYNSYSGETDRSQPGEWMRNCYFELDPTTEFLSAEGGNSLMKFAPTSLAVAALGGPTGSDQFRAPFGTPVSQIRYVMHWKWVPWDFVCAGHVPKNMANCFQTLNDRLMFDYFPAGTLRFEPPKITRYAAPIRYTKYAMYYCDIALPFVYFDPPRGLPTDHDNYPIRGHNLCPWRLNNLWYPAVRTFGETPGATNQLFASANHHTIFEKPSLPI